jgi:hypothetical protein
MGVMRTLIFLVLVAGCTDNKKPCEEVTAEYLDDPPTDRCIALDLVSPVAFDRLDVFTAFDLPPTGGVLTPQMIAAGETVPSASVIIRGNGGAVSSFSTPTTTFVGEMIGPGQSYQPYIAIAATRNGQVVATAGSDLVHTLIGEAMNFDATFTLLPVETSNVEIWGTGHGLNPCARVTDATTVFFVTNGDSDCDGVGDATDCDSHAYCDPTAGACACP